MSARGGSGCRGHAPAWSLLTAVLGRRPGSVGRGHGLSGVMIYERRGQAGPRMSGGEVDGSWSLCVVTDRRAQRNTPVGQEGSVICSQMRLGLGDPQCPVGRDGGLGREHPRGGAGTWPRPSFPGGICSALRQGPLLNMRCRRKRTSWSPNEEHVV